MYYQGFPYVLQIIWTKLIRRQYNNLLAGYFDIKKIKKLITQKYYWLLIFYYDFKDYVKSCNVYLALQIIQHKSYSNLQFLPILNYYWRNLLINFITKLLILIDKKRNNYDSIFIIIDLLTKIVYYNPVKVIINIPDLVKVIINIVVRHYDFLILIVSNRKLLFTLKF